MDILTIQSRVVRGHVGLDAAVLPLQLLGHEVDAVPTVVFSNHLGWPEATGRVLDPAWIRDLVDGVARRGLERCRCLLTGFIGGPELAEVVLHALETVRSGRPDALYACDPVMGNEDGFYVEPGVPEFLRDRIVPHADILLPNHMELEFLAGRPIASLDEAHAAASELRAAGAGTVVVTSLDARAGFRERIPVLAVTGEGAWHASVERLEVASDGAGDVFAAVFAAATLNGEDTPGALGHALSAIHGVLRRTAELGAAELALVEARREIVSPTRRVTVEPFAA